MRETTGFEILTGDQGPRARPAEISPSLPMP